MNVSQNGPIGGSFDARNCGTDAPQTLHSDFSPLFRRRVTSLSGTENFPPDFFHFCQHNFMEREYQWDRFGRLIKSRSAGSFFFSPLSFAFFYPLHLSLNILSAQAFPLQPVFPLSHSFLPLPVLYSPMHPSIRYLLSRAGLLHNLAGSFSFHIIPQTNSIFSPFFSFGFNTERGGEAALFRGETQTRRKINWPDTLPLTSL